MVESVIAIESGWALVVLNPAAGRYMPDHVRSMLETLFGQSGRRYRIYATEPGDDLTARIARARQEGCDLVVAAGGDGTVSLVANALAGSDIPLGILPTGTANVLALELGISNDVQQASTLLVGEHRIRALDMMQLGDRHFILQIGIGLDSLMIKDTGRQAKRLFGRLAYMTTLVGKLFGYRSCRFTIVVDGRRMRPRAWQVLVANAGTLGVPPFRWGPDIHPYDGVLDLCIFNVRTWLDYLRILKQFLRGQRRAGPNITYVRIRQQVTIASDPPLPVQADGEIIGKTPIQVRVRPQAVRVIVPAEQLQASTMTLAQGADSGDEGRAQGKANP